MSVSDYFKKKIAPTTKVRLRDVYRELPGAALSTGKKILGAFQRSGQSALRGMAGVGSAITGKTLTPSTYFQKQLYGTDQPLTAQRFGEETGIKGKFAAPVGFALGAADLIPGGQVSRQGAVKLLKNANKADDALRILTKTMGIAQDVATRYTDDAVRLTDEKSLFKLVNKVVDESQQVSHLVQKGKSLFGVGKNADPLITEARKYKSAEEFVKGQGETVFRGGSKPFDKTLIGEDGVFVTPSKFMAETFGKNVDELVISPKAKVLSYNDLPASIKAIDNWDEYSVAVSRYGRERGVDVIDSLPPKADFPRGMERTVLNPEVLKTKSQLTDIWKKAQGVTQSGTKTRGFIESAREVIPQADKIAGQYIPRSTDNLAIRAKNLIRDNFAEAEKIARTGSDDKAVAVASELLKKYADDAAKATDPAVASALYDKAAEVANTLAPKLTEQGRSIQAASILGRLTPEGQLRWASREIQRFNETAKVKIPDLTGEQSRRIIEEMTAINQMEEGLDKARRFQQLQDYVKSLVPTPLVKKIVAVWKAGLLTGIKTTGLNLFSNLSHSVTEVVKDVPASIVDSVASLFTGKRAKTFTLRGAKGVKEGFERGFDYLKTGFDERNLAQKLDYSKVNFGEGAVAKAFQVYTDTVFRVMGASDQPFYYGALSRSLYDQALAQGKNGGKSGKELIEFAEKLVSSPTEEMIRFAVADAATAVFQNETYLGKAAKSLQNIPIVGEILVPFARTPSAVATQIINYTPVGTAVEIIKQIARGSFDQRQFSQAVGRGITGTGVLSIGYELAKRGMVALDRPKDEREQKLWELEGRKPNSIKIGGKWRSPIVLGPAGNLLLIGAHFQNAYEEFGSPTEALTKAMLGSAKSFTEQTFLTGINQAVGAINDPARFASSYLGNLVSSVVPTFVSDVARSIDPNERRPETIPQRFMARIPILRETLEPKVDTLGRPVARIGNPLEVLLDPTRPSQDVSTPTINELRRLTDAGFAVSPTLLGDSKGYKKLTQEQNTRLWEFAGSIANDKLTSLFSRQQYQELEDDEKGKLVERIVEQSKVNARAGMVIELTDGLRGEELLKKLSELKETGLLTREVLKKYQELR